MYKSKNKKMLPFYKKYPLEIAKFLKLLNFEQTVLAHALYNKLESDPSLQIGLVFQGSHGC